MPERSHVIRMPPGLERRDVEALRRAQRGGRRPIRLVLAGAGAGSHPGIRGSSGALVGGDASKPLARTRCYRRWSAEKPLRQAECVAIEAISRPGVSADFAARCGFGI